MRHFVVIGHTASLEPNFPLDDLPGSAGRMDVLCRCVNSGLLLSHGIRQNTRVSLVLQDDLTIRFDGETLRYTSPDERNIAGLIRNALEAKTNAIGAQHVESSPGVTVAHRGIEPVLDDLTGTKTHLHEDGDPLTTLPTEIQDPVFILSDHLDFTPAEASLLADRVDHRVTVGPERLHADHTITVVHNYLDTKGYTRYA